MRDLDLWLHGVRLARVTPEPRRRFAPLAFAWTDEGKAAFDGRRILSAAMRVGSPVVPAVASAFLDGLLPEGNARKNYALAAGISDPDDTLGLLAHYGADTPGAAQIVAAGSPDPTHVGSYTALTLDDVAERVRRADQTGIRPGSSALPGMVPKIALHRAPDGAWLLPRDGAPSTWILKRGGLLAEGDDVVDTELLCLDVARRVGLTSVQAEIIAFDDVRAIAVSRYDRYEAGGRVERIHQEDFAQALTIPASDVNAKFQWGRQRPSFALIAGALDDAGADTQPLARLAAFSWMVGNTDMHAKNISAIRGADEAVDLAPAYDVSMRLHRSGAREFALDYGGAYRAPETTAAHLVREIASWPGWTQRRAQRTVHVLAEDLATALASINHADHPGVAEPIIETVARRIADAAPGSGTVAPVRPVRSRPRRR